MDNSHHYIYHTNFNKTASNYFKIKETNQFKFHILLIANIWVYLNAFVHTNYQFTWIKTSLWQIAKKEFPDMKLYKAFKPSFHGNCWISVILTVACPGIYLTLFFVLGKQFVTAIRYDSWDTNPRSKASKYLIKSILINQKINK